MNEISIFIINSLANLAFSWFSQPVQLTRAQKRFKTSKPDEPDIEPSSEAHLRIHSTMNAAEHIAINPGEKLVTGL